MTLFRRRPEPQRGRTGVYHPSAHETDQEWRERWKFRIEVVGFVVLVFGAIVGYCTLGQLREQTSTLQQQVYRGDRAYLLIRNVRLIGDGGPLETGDRLWLQWDTVNVGRTPAQNLISWFELYYGDRAADPPNGLKSGYSEARVLGPSDAENSPDMAGVWMDDTPGRLITSDEKQRLDAGELFLNARIVVTYDTVFPSVRGRTEVCAYYEGARFSYCGVRGTQIQ